MNKKSLWLICIFILLYSCGIKPTSESNKESIIPTKKPEPTSTNESSNPIATNVKQADAEFNLSTINKLPPDYILNEISYYVGGGWSVCSGELLEDLTIDAGQIDVELMELTFVHACGWKEKETVVITIYYPDGRIVSQKTQSEEDIINYYASAKLKFGIEDPAGVYKIVFDGDSSGTIDTTINVHKPTKARLFRVDETNLLLYGFQPLESVILYYYQTQKFAGWQTYTVNQYGQLSIEVPAYTGYRHACMGLVDDFFVAVGEKSGETRLLQDTCVGALNRVMEDSIIWSCGNLKTRLSISPESEKRVAYTDGSNMRIRKKPGFNEEIVDSVPEGTKITITEGPVCVDNVTWWKISGGPKSNEEGWMAEHNNKVYWLEPIP